MTLRTEQRQHIETLIHLSEGRDTSLAGCREVILRSWQRCVGEYRLDPGRPRQVRVLTRQALLEHREPVDELLHVARAGVDQLYAQVARLGYVLLLTDHRGITVDFRGQPEHDQALRKAGLYLGADWDERYAGTCAVGTCIHNASAITCHQSEHFDATHIGLTCTAAPITDPQGEVIAVLDISALQSPRSQESQNFGLSLVNLYARMIAEGRFREDLYYRLNGAQLRLPALRERADRHFVIRSVYEGLLAERDEARFLRADAMSALLGHAWPGNIRQLRNALSFALATSEGEEVTVNDLPEECQEATSSAVYLPPAPADGAPGDDGQALHDLLEQAHWNVSLVARRLGVSRPTVYRRMQRHGLVAPNHRGRG
ncbi:helix-turn-helix domain-containing protein [Halomonas sp. MA07-2]|uniref:helix-turn-helix domain-containing protein n=1 Tax=Halomonas sp. MA07-2 TaxID=3440841 RepID=UPI003EE9213A